MLKRLLFLKPRSFVKSYIPFTLVRWLVKPDVQSYKGYISMRLAAVFRRSAIRVAPWQQNLG